MFPIPWLPFIPLCPLVASIVIFTMKPAWSRIAAGVAISAMAMSTVLAFAALSTTFTHPQVVATSFDWFSVGDQHFDFGFILNPLTGSTAAMVTFVGLLIFIYSAAYMEHDENKTCFFGYLSLFAFGMLGLVISNSLLLLFMCWEIVGLASYLLIGFWYQKPSAAAAAKKAFITTRIGDLGFLLGLFWVYRETGTFLFYHYGSGILEPGPLAALASSPGFWGFSAAGAISLLIFAGAMGKSGQFPLHVWLPDAMEGPTPVSALIHAATMVAAGVFLVARTYPLFALDGRVLAIVAWVGVGTALFAAIIAVAQFDIKRILAYSTISQLGLMMAGIGVGGPPIGMFHLLTHAFFKALLFLGAGSIIHGCHGEQDIRKMGGIARPMPVTTLAYLCGVLALCAFPFTSGYFSKDEILLSAWHSNPAIFWVAAIASLLTAFYMTRQCCYVFLGVYRNEEHRHPHESSWVMVGPLLILAIFALAGGAVAHMNGILEYLGDKEPLVVNSTVVVIGWIISLGGISLGFLAYGLRPLTATGSDPFALTILGRAFYLDEIYAATFGRLVTVLSYLAEIVDAILLIVTELLVFIAREFSLLFAFKTDRVVIDRWFFDDICSNLRSLGGVVTRPQDGLLSNYLRSIALGSLLLAILFWCCHS